MKLVLLIAAIVLAFAALLASLHHVHIGPPLAWLAAALLFYFVSTVARK